MNSEMGFSFRSSGVCVMIIRGELAMGASSRRTLVCGRSVWILTMMQSCASAAKLRAAGPFSPSASVPCQLPVPATSDCQSAVRAERQRERRIGNMWSSGGFSACRTQDDALQSLTSRDKAGQSVPLRPFASVDSNVGPFPEADLLA